MKGHVAGHGAEWFEGMDLVQEPDGTTVIRCPALDQAALHGVLRTLRDLGLALISVTRTGPTADPPRTSSPPQTLNPKGVFDDLVPEDRPRRRHPLPRDLRRVDRVCDARRTGPQRSFLRSWPAPAPTSRSASRQSWSSSTSSRSSAAGSPSSRSCRRVHEGLAVGYLATRLFEGAVITMSVVGLLSIITIHKQVAAGADGPALVPVAAALVAVRNWAIVIGSNMAPFNALMLGTALYRARLVPRALPALGLVGAPILITWVAAQYPRPQRARDHLPRHRRDAVLHLGARARPVADVQGLQRELTDRGRRAARADKAETSGRGAAFAAEAGAA